MHFDQKHYKLADKINAMEPGESLKQAMMDSGYSETTASRGWESVPNRVLKLLAKKGIRLRELGKIDAKTQEEIVRGRLVYNTIKGSDKGVLSAKALGSDKRISMFAPDIQTGVIVLQMPSSMIENKDKLLAAEENEAEQDHNK
jgi:hypothetical protein